MDVAARVFAELGSPESLRKLIEQPVDERPAENLYFEFKRDWVPNKVVKTIAAFANASGGLFFLGADAVGGRLDSFPGLATGTEWPLRIADLISGQISPYPVWHPRVLAAPSDASRVVVLVRVDPSPDRPLVLSNGTVYIRSPGGKSEPVADRATLDRLIDQGGQHKRLVEDRARVLVQLVGRPPDRWQFCAASVPIPYDGGLLDGPLTGLFAYGAEQSFQGRRLRNGKSGRALEDGIGIDFGDAHLDVFQDRVVRLWYHCRNANSINASFLKELVFDLVAGQKQLVPDLTRVRLAFMLRGHSGATVTGGDQTFPSQNSPPDPWLWSTYSELGELPKKLERLQNRLWRAGGEQAFDEG